MAEVGKEKEGCENEMLKAHIDFKDKRPVAPYLCMGKGGGGGGNYTITNLTSFRD